MLLKSHFYFYWLTMLLLVHCLHLDIFPPKIDPGVTDSLLINCSLPSTKLSGMMTLSSLTLFKSFDNDSQLIELCSVSSNTGYKDHNAGDGTGNGVINSKDGSYLSLIWLFPNQHMIGHYKCQADGISPAWKKITVTSRASVSGHDMSVSNLSDQLRLVQLENVRNKNLIEQFIESITKHETILEEIKSNLTDLQTRHVNMNRELKNFQNDRLESLETLFYKSSPYEGRHYYLTKELVTFTATSAQATCQLYGGYLAEIDSSEELNFVRTFVNRYNNLNTVWISGSDEDIEGLWIHPRTKATIKYFNWPPSEPDGGRSQNCLCLQRSYNWLISSGGCIAQDLGLSLAYLCEVYEKNVDQLKHQLITKTLFLPFIVFCYIYIYIYIYILL
ncbi:uncharacterized protein LOC106066901 isoform X1 [Biomphalaria glabrata]|uniref:Uncharacterized protein LOC106066901 isoform X1 n=2 Tax=Biomphalaria glabrata TaxID=6526 RepID=A0A9U8EC16_BIOGL|nr:uncharacterized protein LOC106066901 isoform X1 [Biomphalaria glabrata]